MAIFRKGETRGIGLKTRVEAAEALDLASPFRLRTPGDPDYWVEISGGRFTIGDPGAYGSLPVKSVKVPTFQIGRFPVTVWEYGQYLKDAKRADKPRLWEVQALHRSRPVVYVTWHDGQSYCEWVRGKWGVACRLPTDEQWEFAARGPEGRIYPWGPEEQEPDEHRANFGLSVGDLTPVGMFPDGDTPEGVADMAGNVWEWTRSDFDGNSKSVRGASIHYVAIYLRGASRMRNGPDDLNINLGFRCVRE